MGGRIHSVCSCDRVSSTHSHDAHLLHKLDTAISAGDRGLLQDIASTVKSSHALQEVIIIVTSALSPLIRRLSFSIDSSSMM